MRPRLADMPLFLSFLILGVMTSEAVYCSVHGLGAWSFVVLLLGSVLGAAALRVGLTLRTLVRRTRSPRVIALHLRRRSI